MSRADDNDGMIAPDWAVRFKRAATDEDKLVVMIEWVTESHLYAHGGYPYDGMWIGDKFIVAGLDDSKDRMRTALEVYTKKQLLSWFNRTSEFRKTYDGEITLWECLYETAS